MRGFCTAMLMLLVLAGCTTHPVNSRGTPVDPSTEQVPAELDSLLPPLPPTDPPTVPLSSLTIEKRKDPDVSATMLYLSQENGIVEVFCRLDVSIGEKGKVTDLAVHECHPDLVEPVSTAVRKWRFATPDGDPRRVTIVLPVRSYAESRGMGVAP